MVARNRLPQQRPMSLNSSKDSPKKSLKGGGRIYVPKIRSTAVLFNFLSFVIGVVLCLSVTSMYNLNNNNNNNNVEGSDDGSRILNDPQKNVTDSASATDPAVGNAVPLSDKNVILFQKKILVALASFNLDQLTFLEEQLEGYRGLAEAGAEVSVVIHATEPYSVALIDILNTRMYFDSKRYVGSFNIKVVLLNPHVRLHLVDHHRTLFYDNLDNFDLFIYSEDDMKANVQAVATYLEETERVKSLIGAGKASNYNVGIIRYEYNYPYDVIIDDNTRLLTREATRVFWEHSQGRPVFEKVTDEVNDPALSPHYMTLRNDHQGMFMATSELLRAWKIRGENCRFNEVRDRPGWKNKPSQPAEGTQRVWMSSKMLYGKKHCHVQLLLPVKSFGKMNVHHIPNKNYRRVGRKGRLGGYTSDARDHLNLENITFVGPHPSLMKVYEVHFGMREKYPFSFTNELGVYDGIQMINKFEGRNRPEIMSLVTKRMEAFKRYADGGGILTTVDMENYL